MARLIYANIASLDGYIADEQGRFEWAMPPEDVHAFVNELERSIGTFLLGRRLYEVMRVWDTIDTGPDQHSVMREFAEIWRAADKVVYSTTLEEAPEARTRLERSFDLGALAAMKDSSSSDISVGGPGLAAHAFRAGLVDEVHLFLVPYLAGAGTRALPDGVRGELELLDERRFSGGVVYLHHRWTGVGFRA